MCVLSMVMDGFQPLVPRPAFWEIPTRPFFEPSWVPPMPTKDLKELLEAFRIASEAAKKADAITKQADCADPEKVALEERVKELERRIAELEARDAAAAV